MRSRFSLRFTFLWLTLLVGMLTSGPLHAIEADGWLFTISPKTLARSDGPGNLVREIDRDLVLKAVLKNTSMKDQTAGKVEFAILIRRWGGEIGKTERYSGTLDLQAVNRGQQIELNTAPFHIGGHLHGTSRMHVDDLEAWKFTVVAGEKRTEFRSGPKFDLLDKRAVPAR